MRKKLKGERCEKDSGFFYIVWYDRKLKEREEKEIILLFEGEKYP